MRVCIAGTAVGVDVARRLSCSLLYDGHIFSSGLNGLYVCMSVCVAPCTGVVTSFRSMSFACIDAALVGNPGAKPSASSAVVVMATATGDCITAQVSGGEAGEAVFIHSVCVRCMEAEGLVFVSMTKPDIDALGRKHCSAADCGAAAPCCCRQPSPASSEAACTHNIDNLDPICHQFA